jgi:hypothetical protein
MYMWSRWLLRTLCWSLLNVYKEDAALLEELAVVVLLAPVIMDSNLMSVYHL